MSDIVVEWCGAMPVPHLFTSGREGVHLIVHTSGHLLPHRDRENVLMADLDMSEVTPHV